MLGEVICPWKIYYGERGRSEIGEALHLPFNTKEDLEAVGIPLSSFNYRKVHFSGLLKKTEADGDKVDKVPLSSIDDYDIISTLARNFIDFTIRSRSTSLAGEVWDYEDSEGLTRERYLILGDNPTESGIVLIDKNSIGSGKIRIILNKTFGTNEICIIGPNNPELLKEYGRYLAIGIAYGFPEGYNVESPWGIPPKTILGIPENERQKKPLNLDSLTTELLRR